MNPIKKFVHALTGGAANAPLAGSAVASELLARISEAKPCGDSLEYDTEYAVLQARLEPKADVQYGKFQSKPDAPEWAEVERDARRLLLKSKDISILVWFTRARCRMAGASGLLEGLSTLQAVLQAYPEQVHPQRVLDGVPDPAVRANALAALCDPEGLLSDVREVVVTGNTALRLTVRDVERALAFPRPPYAPEPETVKRQLADLHGKRDVPLLALLDCGACVQVIDQWAQTALQDDAPNLAPLTRLLAALGSFAEPEKRSAKVHAEALEQSSGTLMAADDYRPSDARSLQEPHDRQSLTTVTPPVLHQSIIEEREQIRALLRQVRQWIEHHEPSSPVTILIKQADRMWGKRFSEIATMIPPDLMKAWDSDE
jgi:type VI secretion system protein ImpA